MIKKILLVLLLVFFMGNIASADDYNNEEPFVYLSFADPNLKYQSSLKKAVDNAIRIKPSVFFDIVATIPEGEDKRFQSDIITQNVVNNIKSFGVVDDRIRVRTKSSDKVKANEVRIYVR